MHHQRSLLTAATLLCLTFAVAPAQNLADYDYENLRFRGVGLDFGFIWPNKVESSSAYSLKVDLGYLGPGVRISPVISYWSSPFRQRQITRFADQLNRLPALRDEGVVIQPEELGGIDWSDLSLSLDAHIVWTTPARLITYIGGGLAVHVLNGRGSAIEGTFVEDLLDTVTGGVAAMGGVELPVTPHLRVYGEARYTLLSDIGYPGARVGVAFMLPQPVATTGVQGGR